MWLFAIALLVGIMLSVLSANNWLVVPDYCIWICFGVAALVFIIWLCNFISVKKAIKKTSRRW